MCRCIAVPGVEVWFCLRVGWKRRSLSGCTRVEVPMHVPVHAAALPQQIWGAGRGHPSAVFPTKFESRITLGRKQSFFFSSTAGNFAAFNHAARLTSLPFQTAQASCSTKVVIGREDSEAALGCSVVTGHITHMISFPS